MECTSNEFRNSNRCVRMALPAVARRILSGRLRQADELTYASQRLPTVEINGSFYSLQTPASYAVWYAATTKEFMEREPHAAR